MFFHQILWKNPNELFGQPSIKQVKNPPSIQETQETQVLSLSQKDSLEKEMATHSVFLPGKSHGQSNLVGYSPWGPKELNVTE